MTAAIVCIQPVAVCIQARRLRVDIAADELRLVRRVVERRDNPRPVQVVEALGEKVVGVDVEDHLEVSMISSKQ